MFQKILFHYPASSGAMRWRKVAAAFIKAIDFIRYSRRLPVRRFQRDEDVNAPNSYNSMHGRSGLVP